MSKLRVTVEVDLDDAEMSKEGITPQVVVDNLAICEHEVVDGLEVYRYSNSKRRCFVIKNPTIISTQIID